MGDQGDGGQGFSSESEGHDCRQVLVVLDFACCESMAEDFEVLLLDALSIVRDCDLLKASFFDGDCDGC